MTVPIAIGLQRGWYILYVSIRWTKHELKQMGTLQMALESGPKLFKCILTLVTVVVINLELDEWGYSGEQRRGQRSSRQVGTFKLCSAEAQQVPSQRRRRVRGDFGCLPLTSYILHTWLGGSTVELQH